MLLVERGFRTATLARDSFSKLLAAGLTRRVRAAGVRDRRRRDARDPADRRDAAVRVLRRLVDPRELRAARAAAAGLRPRAPAGGQRSAGGGCGERARRPPVRPRARAVRACSSRSRRAGRCSRPRRCATTRTTAAILFEEQRIKRGIIRAADGDGAGGQPARCPQERFERRYPTGELFAQPVGFTSLDRGRTGIEDYYNDPLTGRRSDAIGALERLLGPQDVGDDLRTTLDAERPGGRLPAARRPARRRRGARRQDRRGARDGGDAVVRPERPGERQDVQPRHPGPLPAGLDDEGRDRHGGARHRRLHSPTRASAARTAR